MTFGWAGAGGGANATFTCDLADVVLSAGSCDGLATVCTGVLAAGLEEPGEVTGFAGAITGLTAPAGFAGAVCGRNAGLIRSPVVGVLAAGCTPGFAEV